MSRRSKQIKKIQDNNVEILKNSAPPSDMQALADIIRSKKFMDTFGNPAARTGFGSPNLINSSGYAMTRLTDNFVLLTTLYRNSWIIRRIIDVKAGDMVKSGFEISSSMTADEKKQVKNILGRTRTIRDIKTGLKWASLYGGAIGVMVIDGQFDLSQPLDYDLIGPNSYRGLLVVDRWDGLLPSLELVTDITSPDRGTPKYYGITNQEANVSAFEELGQDSLRIHHSRVVRFEGLQLPAWEKRANFYWGESDVEPIFEELVKRDNTSANIAALIFQANLKVFGLNQYEADFGSMTERAKADFYETVAAINHLMSSQNIMVMNKEDTFDTKSYSFAGLSEVYDKFMLDIAGAANMPVTKLFGREPAGLSATGESDLVNYDESLGELQEDRLKPVLEKLAPVVCISEIGYYPDDANITFNPIRALSDNDRVDLANKGLTAMNAAFMSGFFSKEQALKGAQEVGQRAELYNFITDEDIAKAAAEDAELAQRNAEMENMLNNVNVEEEVVV